MGNAAGEETKALRIAAINGDGASTQASVPPVEQMKQRPAPLPAAGVTAGGGSAGAQSCGEDNDDEQVERFYALLANIRALRGLCSAGESGSPAAGGRGRKRAREAEAASWRPAFRMEDFAEEEVSQVAGNAPCHLKKQQQGAGAGAGVARRPAVATARAAADDRGEDEVAEEVGGGTKLGRRVAAQG